MILKKILSQRFGHIQRLNFYGILVIILFNECIVYYLQRFRWESVACETDECNRVLLIADPQILGEERETRWYARYDNDKHIHRNFKQAFSHVKPDVVIFLGDLIDESSFADDLKYSRYFARFKEIFPEIEGIEMIYLPGDNDIGGEGTEMVKPSKVKRFNNYFENRSVYRLKNKLNFYHINRIIHEMPLLPDSEAEQVQENSGYTRVFISHFSVVLTPGAFSYKAIQRFKPHVCFTGHYHKSSQITSEINKLRLSATTLFLSHTMTYDLRTIEANQEVLEIQVPSCSYRMGEAHIGFGQAVFENGYLHYTPLFIINRFTQFKMYVVFGFVLILVNVLISRNLRNVLRRFKLIRQSYHMI